MNPQSRRAKARDRQADRIPRTPAPPELSDEAAAQIQHLLSEWFLWFSAVYREPIRRYYEPWSVPPRRPPPRHRIDDPF
jgi:hypothetical protein